MIRLIVEKTRRLNESIYNPYDGIFWVINNDLISFQEQVDTYGKLSTTFEHKDIWNEIKSKYLVNDKEVSYDYFPRGRVMVNPVYDSNNKFSHYECYIYIDDCINNDEIIQEIIYNFRLNGNNCDIKYVGSDGGITSNHYTCNRCKR